jgi:hypothetical protein
MPHRDFRRSLQELSRGFEVPYQRAWSLVDKAVKSGKISRRDVADRRLSLGVMQHIGFRLAWRISRRYPTGVKCAMLPFGGVSLRNSRDPDGPALIYTPAEIESFVRGLADGDFDNLLA